MANINIPGFKLIWRNEKRLERAEVILATLLAIILFGAYINLIIIAPELSAFANVFALMLIFSGVFFVGKKHFALQTVGFGKTQNLIFAVVAGIGLGFFLVQQSLIVFNPFATIALAGTSFALFERVIVGVVAPLAEETFFRGALQPTIFEWTREPIVAWVGQAVFFAGYHGGVSGFDFGVMGVSFIFGLIAGIGNSFFQSTGFGYAMHLVNNLVFVGFL